MIKSIKIDVQGQELELTLDEARQLASELQELVGEKWTEYAPYYPYYPYPVYQPPLNQYVWPEITCKGSSDIKIKPYSVTTTNVPVGSSCTAIEAQPLDPNEPVCIF